MTIANAHGITKDAELNGEAQWLRAVVDRVQYFVDVGANKGDWSEMVLRQQQVKGALLIEPGSFAREMLKTRFAGKPEIQIIEAAAGSAGGWMSFFEEPEAGETSSLIAGFSQNAVERKVRLTTVDDEVVRSAWPHVDFLKIDAEGFDFQVLEGCQQLLREGRVCYGQFEYNSPWQESGATLTFALSWLRRFGYRSFLIKRDGLHEPRIQFYGEYFCYSNYAFVREDLVEDALRRSRSDDWMNLP